MIFRTILLAVAALCATTSIAAASPVSTVLSPEESLYPEHIVLLHTDDAGRESLRTPVARYKDADGHVVDLVGAIHLADARYYHALNRVFARYDKVLYEMVDGEDVPEMTRISRKIQAGTATEAEIRRYEEYKKSKKTSGLHLVLGSYYDYMADAMGLALQTEVVDYGRDNLVYADMSSDEFSAAMAKRGESWLTLVLDSLKEGNNGEPASIFSLMTETDLRRFLCRQLAATSQGARTEQRAIIVSRNERCMEVLDRVLADKKSPARRVAIFYGAMHLRDLHARMLQRDFELQGVQWISAIRVEK